MPLISLPQHLEATLSLSVVNRIHDKVKNEKNKAVLQNSEAKKNPIFKKSPQHLCIGSPVKISSDSSLSKDSRKPGRHLVCAWH